MNWAKRVNNIRISLELGSRIWNINVKRNLNVQLEGFPDYVNEKYDYEIIIKNYEELEKQGKLSASIRPYVFDDKILMDRNNKIALRVSEKKLEYWCAREPKLSVPFLVQFLLLKQGKTFIHSAGVSVNGNGKIFPAFGGVGKTALVSNIIKKNRKAMLFGDDLIIVDRNGFMEPYIRPFCLYKYHSIFFPEFYKERNIKYKKRTLLWRVYNKARWTFGVWPSENKFKTRMDYLTVPPEMLFGKDSLAEDKAQLKEIYLLNKTKLYGELKVENILCDDIVRFLTDVIYCEWNDYLKFLIAYLFFTGVKLSEYFKEVEDILSSAIRSVQKTKIVNIPAEEVYEDIVERIGEIVLEG